MRVVVTGATGNVGFALLQALEQEAAVSTVVGIARRRPGARFSKVSWLSKDVAVADLVEAFAGADCVVHLAWLIQPSHDRAATWRTNVLGSRRVFEAVAEAGVGSLVHASSVGAYSPAPKDRHVDETWPTNGIPSSFYSRDKAEVERLLDRLEEDEPDIRVVRLRTSLVFQRAMGSEVKRLFTGRLVPNRLLSPNRIPFVPDLPRLRFQATHAEDVADAYRLAVVGRAKGPFNIASDPVLDPDRLAALLGARKLRVPEPVVRSLLALTWRARLQPTPEGWLDLALETPLLDSTRARLELGWAPRHTSEEALLDVINGFHDGAGAPTPPLS